MNYSPGHNSLIISQNPWERFQLLLERGNYSSIFIIVDHNTEKECLPYFKTKISLEEFKLISIAPGENSKNLEIAQHVWNEMLRFGIDRHSTVICLGGGVVCDLGGFCASNILRGVDFFYIPTSLMALADAALGGKSGINFKHYKNQIGSFIQARAVILDCFFLKTLNDRHLRNGYVEMIKHSLIDDPSYWEDIENQNWPIELNELENQIRKSIRTKMSIVEKDFFDLKERKILNFGHTIGHAIESKLLESGVEVYHGEAIAVGMICESYISAQLFSWRPHTLARIKTMLLPFTNGIKLDLELKNSIFEMIQFDKKKIGKTVLFSLLESPGKAKLDIEVSYELLEKTLDFYQE